ncbi:MAG: hypothetical protein K9W44_05530 [Candidatus Lokiarchaeota archaeon]|nr:hypothetical protein [Candidatus Harpocratesius repetitus]
MLRHYLSTNCTGYHFTLCDYYWRYGIDLRPIPIHRDGERFWLPIPLPNWIKYDSEGFPVDIYWFLRFLWRKQNPYRVFSPNDLKRIPLSKSEQERYEAYSYHGFDKKRFLKLYKKGIRMPHKWTTFKHEIQYCFPCNDEVKVPEFYTYEHWCKKHPGAHIPLYCPTLGDLAEMYVAQATGNTDFNLPPPVEGKYAPFFENYVETVVFKLVDDSPYNHEDVRFPNGFTEEHIEWLIKCATPRIMAYLQQKLPPSDPVLQAIILKFKKKLKNSEFFLV